MLELIKSGRFQEEYRNYHTRIEKITNLDTKNQEMFSGNRVPMGLGDVRSNIIGIRKKLDTLLRDWEQQSSTV